MYRLGIPSFFCFAMAIKSSKRYNGINKAVKEFEAMATGKYYDDIVAVIGKPHEEYEKTCPNTGDLIKVAKWNGGYYFWNQYKYDIVVVFEEDGKFNNVKMSD